MPDTGEAIQILLNQLAHHTIGVFCRHTPTQPGDTLQEDYVTASAFVMEIKGVWYLATAGHYFDNIDMLRRLRPTRRYSFWLADAIRPNPKDTNFVPLDFNGAWKRHIYHEADGIDFGLIQLNPNTCRLLMANDVIPVSESHWQDWSDLRFVDFCMVGIPSRLLTIRPNSMDIRIVMLALRKLEEPPDSFKHHRHPMFYGEIVDLGDIPSIVGMSGCPVIGLTVKDGLPFYCFLAIQSGWLPNSRVICACDLNYLARILISVTDELVSDQPPVS
jgi:hypothetical protein